LSGGKPIGIRGGIPASKLTKKKRGGYTEKSFKRNDTHGKGGIHFWRGGGGEKEMAVFDERRGMSAPKVPG